MNDDLEILDDVLEDVAPEPEPEKPQYVTRNDLNDFAEKIVSGMNRKPEPESKPAGDPKFFDGWDPDTATDVQRFVANEVAKVHQMYAPSIASSAAEKVVMNIAPDAPLETQRYVTGLVNKMGLSPQQIQQLGSDQEGIDYIQTLAAGHAARAVKSTPIPKSSDPAGSVDDFQLPANQKSNMEEFVQSMSSFMTRKEAEKTFKETVKARN